MNTRKKYIKKRGDKKNGINIYTIYFLVRSDSVVLLDIFKIKERIRMEKILKTKPEGIDKHSFTPTTYSIPQGKDKEGNWKPWKQRNLLIGSTYDIETDEPGQELRFTAEFLGWKKETIVHDNKRIPDQIYYTARFKAVSNIEVDTDYSLTITKSEEKRDENGKI